MARLIGAPPGYVGYEEGGYLTEAVRRRPYSVLLLDEIEMNMRVTELMQATFKPEFLNRVDEVIIFHRLSLEDIKGIVDIQLDLLRKRLAERTITLEITDAVKSYLAQQGYDPAYGARPLKRLIQKEIQDQVALALLKGDFRDGDTIRVDERNLGLVFERMVAAEPPGQRPDPSDGPQILPTQGQN